MKVVFGSAVLSMLWLVSCAASSKSSSPIAITQPDLDDSTIILFDGSNLDAWQHREGGPCTWEIQPDGSALVRGGDAVTTQEFRDFHLHVEFFIPPMPEKEGQARSNSGVYLQGRYEVQVLDSYGQTIELNSCGALYSIAKPRANACKPPGEWQTYDIMFRAARTQPDKPVEPARVTVFHNGVMIHDNRELPTVTPGGLDNRANVTSGPILLQDHGDPVRYRNIWLRQQ
jgi:hypothetical protein